MARAVRMSKKRSELRMTYEDVRTGELERRGNELESGRELRMTYGRKTARAGSASWSEVRYCGCLQIMIK